MRAGREPIGELLHYYVVGSSYRMELPTMLARSTRLIVDGRAVASLAMLDLFMPADKGEALLVELLYGWCLTELRELTASAKHLENALVMAKEQGSEAALSMGTVVAATNSLASGRRDESFRLLNQAAAVAPAGSDQSLMALFVLAQILTANRAPAAAEAVLLELWSARDWPPNAAAKITRRLARVRIELDKVAAATALADHIGETATTDRDRVEHALLLAHLAAAQGQPLVGRSELDYADELLSRIDVPHLQTDRNQADAAVAVLESRLTADESRPSIRSVVDAVEVNDLAPRIQGMVIEALTESGDYEEAWRLSNGVVRTHLHEGVDMRGVFDLTIKLHDSQAEARFADVLGSKHEKLQVLDSRASAVLRALSQGVRDPLTVLQLWFGDHGDQGADLERSDSARRMADAAVERVERLLDQVVWLARVDRFVPPGIDRSIDLESLASEAIEKHHRWAKFHNFTIVDVSRPRSVGGTDAPDGVSALLCALLTHASAYSIAGDRVDVEVWIAEGALHIVVTDEGPPIRLASQLTPEEFSASELPSSRIEGGDATGDVGLVLAEALADLFDSTIEIDQLGDGRVTTSTSLPLQSLAPAPRAVG